jgi:hypothetical protein
MHVLQALEKGDLSSLAAPGRQRLKGVKGLQLGGTRGGKACASSTPHPHAHSFLAPHAAGSLSLGMSRQVEHAHLFSTLVGSSDALSEILLIITR